jgi:hypothetical protein
MDQPVRATTAWIDQGSTGPAFTGSRATRESPLTENSI